MQKEILLVDDSAVGTPIVSNYLKPGFQIKHVSTVSDAITELKTTFPASILFDMHSPDQMVNFKLLRSTAPATPIIILTDLDQAMVAVNALKEGADDLLLKAKLDAKTLEQSILNSQEKKLNEVTTRKLQEHMDRFFDTALDMICVANTKGWLIRINPACEKILGFTPAEMCAAPIDSFVHPDDVSKTRASRARVLGGEPLKGFENRYKTRDGSYKTLSWISVFDSGVVYAMARDMSERNRLVGQVQQNERMASLGLLAAGVAHEINNPLAHTSINLELISHHLKKMESDQNIQDLKPFVEEAQHGASRVREIVQSLKLFSNKEELKITSVDLNKIVESAIKFANHEISIRAKLIKNFSGSVYALGSESQLAQVFINLLVNAAQAIPEGKNRENTITVSTGVNADGSPFVQVTDTGIGISEEAKKKIFDPFYTTKPVGVGSGLGLSICHGIVTSLNGKITVHSTFESGTTFTVTLPSADPVTKIPLSNLQDVADYSVQRRMKILIVDDEINFANALKSIIHMNHDVRAEVSSTTALKLVLESPDYDAIFCDMMMPEMTGMEFYQNLVKDGRGLEKKIVFMSGGAFTPQTISFFKDCQNLRLEKPFGMTEFLNLIEKLSKN